MSLADELLADLEDATGEEVAPDTAAAEGDSDLEDIDDVDMEEEDIPADSVRKVAKLRDSDDLTDLLTRIEFFEQKGQRSISGPVEADPEYQLIVDANQVTQEIDNEINVIHKFVRDLYVKRFPELESLIVTPVEYLRTVRELGNDILHKSKNNEVLQSFLQHATIMVVSVTASTTQGTELDKDELARVEEACDMAAELVEHKATILQYVQSRMSYIAPNLSIIVGAAVAAQLMGIAGGLTALSKMPSCNLLVLGQQKRTLAGFSSTQILPHTGLVYYSGLVQRTPPDLRRKAARLVANKCMLCARADANSSASDGTIGSLFLQEIEQKLEKLQEPPPVKQVKALPAPVDAPRKKRGGRRYRKMKERLGMTQMRKQANRMNFAEIEEDLFQDNIGYSLGNLGKPQSGRVRGPPVDSKTKAKISKTLQQKLHKQNQTWGGSTTVKKTVSGTASSVAFTPLQGLEIVNPQAVDKTADSESQKYFSSTSGFFSVGKSSVPQPKKLKDYSS